MHSVLLVFVCYPSELVSSVYQCICFESQVHCISTEFTAKKHGGEKGVPFRIQIDSYALENNNELGQFLHSASCQIKVFKPKGADRKQKTDKDKMDKRSAPEKLKYQPSYDSTLLSECTPSHVTNDKSQTSEIDNSNNTANNNTVDLTNQSSSSTHQRHPTEMVNYSILPNNTAEGRHMIEHHHQQTSNSPSINHIHNNFSPDPSKSSYINSNKSQCSSSSSHDTLVTSSTVADTQDWLKRNRFTSFIKMFANFAGRDLLTLSRDDLTQICGRADGIRLFNALRVKALHPRLTLFLTVASANEDGNDMDIYQAFYLERATLSELEIAIESCLLSFNDISPRIARILYQPQKSNIHVIVTDQVVAVMKDETSFSIHLLKTQDNTDSFVALLKS